MQTQRLPVRQRRLNQPLTHRGGANENEQSQRLLFDEMYDQDENNLETNTSNQPPLSRRRCGIHVTCPNGTRRAIHGFHEKTAYRSVPQVPSASFEG